MSHALVGGLHHCYMRALFFATHSTAGAGAAVSAARVPCSAIAGICPPMLSRPAYCMAAVSGSSAREDSEAGPLMCEAELSSPESTAVSSGPNNPVGLADAFVRASAHRGAPASSLFLLYPRSGGAVVNRARTHRPSHVRFRANRTSSGRRQITASYPISDIDVLVDAGPGHEAQLRLASQCGINGRT